MVPTRVLSIAPDEPDLTAMAEAAALIRRGGLVAFATETVYGLGADATSVEAVARIFAAKGRPATNPLIVHVETIQRAQDCVLEWPETAQILANAFWPGPLTLVLPRSDRIPPIVAAGRDTVALRMPSTPVARELIAQADRPIAAPSANRSTGPSPTQAAHVLADLEGLVDLVLDSGTTEIGLESTVLDLTTREPRILRPGPITPQELRHVLGGLHIRQAEGDTAAPDSPQLSPGRMNVHYAPRTPAERVSSTDRLVEYYWPDAAALVIIGSHPDMPAIPTGVHRFELPTPQLAARDFYRVLRECDDHDLERIVILPPPDLPEWHTIRDRIWRATQASASGRP